MIYELKRTAKRPLRCHTVIDFCTDEILGEGMASDVFQADIKYCNDTYSIRRTDNTGSLIMKNDAEYGIIAQKFKETKKIGPIKFGYGYFEIFVNQKTFCLYEIGLGRDQHYFVVHSDEKVVAIIRKRDFTADYLNAYILFSVESDAMCVAVLMTMFLESTAFFDIVEEFEHSNQRNIYHTTQKELMCKYDSDFIPKVIMLHESSLDRKRKERLND